MGFQDWERASRSDDAYKMCVAGSGAAGAVAGGIVGGAASVPTAGTSFLATVPAGIALGLAAGYLACPYLAPMIKRRFQLGQPLSASEVRSAAEAMGRYAGVSSARDALKLVAIVRANAAASKTSSSGYSGRYYAHMALG